ncbi:MAG TPA: hypothetical protein VKS78_15170 [Roseiarcus sp.]|nr:hypothetical protein [Roseiarcus sp.]
MKHLIGMAALFIAATSTGAALADGQETRKCDFEVKARCASGDATVTLADGKVTKLEVNVFWCGQSGSPGYTCTIDSSRSEKDDKWSDEGGVTIIDNASPFDPTHPDRVKVTVGRYVSIALDEAQSLGRCGAGAELPRAIVIPAQKGACRVWLRAP